MAKDTFLVTFCGTQAAGTGFFKGTLEADSQQKAVAKIAETLKSKGFEPTSDDDAVYFIAWFNPQNGDFGKSETPGVFTDFGTIYLAVEPAETFKFEA